jgi:LmbE family N-acetylglucosaminyl deacetylase
MPNNRVTMAVSDIGIRREDPTRRLDAPVLILAPHSDDETLACGGTIALLGQKMAVHVAYATDGRMSPLGTNGGPVSDVAELVALRRRESRDAAAALGLPPQNLHFLDFPDGSLTKDLPQFETALEGLLKELRPATVFAPFRHDQHPDHLATHRGAVRVLQRLPGVRLYQYFIYFRFPFGGIPDVRQSIDPRYLVSVDISATLSAKRRALALYRSQVRPHYSWQTRASLSADFLESHCMGEEIFVLPDGLCPDSALFRTRSPVFWAELYFGPRMVRLKKRYGAKAGWRV